ncbi:MAG: hypothetical protein ABI140_02020 [Jatrophihabitantaceae bacterium]
MIMRDLAPKNVIVGDGSVSIVDFGIAAHGEVTIEGATPGYAPASQQRRLAAHETDDCFALTLIFALTGSDPVVAGEDPEWSRIRAIESLRNLDAGPSQPLPPSMPTSRQRSLPACATGWSTSCGWSWPVHRSCWIRAGTGA